MRVALTLTLVTFGLASSSYAQPDGRWLVVPHGPGATEASMGETLATLSRALRAKGTEVWSLEEASARFESKGSRPPRRLTAAELQSFGHESSAGASAIGYAEYEQALKHLDEAMGLARLAVETLNRERDRARQTLDTCLHSVRVFVDTKRPGEARERARECRTLVPRGSPSSGLHPPWVLEILQDVDGSRKTVPGAIRIDSEPSGCVARVNGLAMGTTPIEVQRLLPGEYQVQVECDLEQWGRAHVTKVGATRESVYVDARFDRVVESRPWLSLRDANATSTAALVAAVPSDAVVLVSVPNAKVLELVRFDRSNDRLPAHRSSAPTGERVSGPPPKARVRFSTRGGPDAFADAVDALLAPRCVDLTGDEPAQISCTQARR